MLTAIGVGTQILHLIPKKNEEAKIAGEIFKSYLVQLIPYILAICGILYLESRFFFQILSRPEETVFLLFISSVYWLFRHYYLARFVLVQILAMDVIVWIVTSLGLIVIWYFEKITTSNILLLIGFSYLASIVWPVFSLTRHKFNYVKNIIPIAVSMGFSNLVSGGVVNLAPSICFHIGSPALAGMVGLITNISSIALTVIRAFLLKIIPRISLAILDRNKNDFSDLFFRSKSKIRLIIFVNIILIQPLSFFTNFAVQPSSSIYEVLLYTLLLSAFVCVPQFSAIESIIINFLDKTKFILIANLIHAFVVISVTFLSYFYWGKNPVVFFVFLSCAIIFYFIRNEVISKVVISEAIRRGLS